jgi:hypothetical protein
MRRGGNGRRESWHRRYDMDIFLRMAAYRATHGGRHPPLNSDLWMEHARMWEERHRPTRLGRLLGRRRLEAGWGEAPPLERYPVVKPFLSDDYTRDQVAARLEAWPMITSMRMVDRDPAGEWFLVMIEVLAENKRQAGQIVECIFLLEPRMRSNPEVT